MTTLNSVMTPHGVEVPAHLIADAEVTLRPGIQRQGDVLVQPMRPGKIDGLALVSAGGVAVVRGEAGGNTHLLVAEGRVEFAARHNARGTVALGTLVIGPESAAYLIHPEHGAIGIAPGTYRVSRQREQAEIVRLVAD